MVTPAAPPLPPVFVLSTGRCGSTMVSNILNQHPEVLSLSEFFSYVGAAVLRRRRVSGAKIWQLCSRPQNRTRLMLHGNYEELIYPFDRPAARYTRQNVPPLLCATLPHLTADYYALFDRLAPLVSGQPKQSPAAHFRRLFDHLGRDYGRRVWVERSGGSLLFGARLLRAFPEARVIHVYRDGRETALSMRRHYLFRMIVANLYACRSWGLDAIGLLAHGRHWERISPWLELVSSALVNPDKLPYDRLTLADFGAFWNGMIARGERIFGHFPPERLLNIKFEDMQANPAAEIRRMIRFISPELDDPDWLRAVVSIPRPTPTRFEQLPADEQAALDAACRPGLDKLGY